ncbi:MAG: CTP synthase (glutamine hydrolyzing) [Nanoarchaeota archaeon]|nr:CTP synthase (glutamine hydrolyzing) [Nanoarchaeota archaeon]MBU1030574.1 CTP synthase (glutamine hydrolyzing) [Nanoarchaeota archaeon]MBU1849382.1 CTP synthase (glutamine hydrolyzing) [Nanoarchaeota archaeon]
MPKTKFIIVTGGVLSGLGKGVACASIGNLLFSKYKVIPVKCDGYLNVDPGTMNPIEHGEVFVLEDGGEVDMDFGHYERFLGVSCKFNWNLTMGKVFDVIRKKERKGDFLGKTVQFIPHVTGLIKEWWFSIAKEEKADILLIEIGGTVGDLENELYIEAARQLKRDVGIKNVMYAHLTYVPVPYGVHEQKSKPTQQSVNLLREKGIVPNIIIGRCSEILSDKIKEKIAIFCDVKKEAVITGLDVDNVYKIPIIFEKEGVSKILKNCLHIKVEPNLKKWSLLVKNMGYAKKTVRIAICGKYTTLEDSYASIIEALNHCGAHLKCGVKAVFVETTDMKNIRNIKSHLKDIDGVIVPGGFGGRGVEGKIEIIKYCRKNNIPFLGICYGMQLAIVEFARNVCGLKNANTTEINPKTKHPVIDILPEQKKISEMGGTMRLGTYPAILKKDSKIFKLYGAISVSERHRHRYEVNPDYIAQLEKKGVVFSGMSPDRKLCEFMELPSHPYFVGCQGHPELKSGFLKPAPLFYGLVKTSLERKKTGFSEI